MRSETRRPARRCRRYRRRDGDAEAREVLLALILKEIHPLLLSIDVGRLHSELRRVFTRVQRRLEPRSDLRERRTGREDARHAAASSGRCRPRDDAATTRSTSSRPAALSKSTTRAPAPGGRRRATRGPGRRRPPGSPPGRSARAFGAARCRRLRNRRRARPRNHLGAAIVTIKAGLRLRRDTYVPCLVQHRCPRERTFRAVAARSP